MKITSNVEFEFQMKTIITMEIIMGPSLIYIYENSLFYIALWNARKIFLSAIFFNYIKMYKCFRKQLQISNFVLKLGTFGSWRLRSFYEASGSCMHKNKYIFKKYTRLKCLKKRTL